MQYKKFDLERALAGDPVITREGHKVSKLVFFEVIKGQSVFALINGVVRAFWRDGSWCGDVDADFDLFMAPVKREVFINLYRASCGGFKIVFKDEDLCPETDPGFIKTIKIHEYEE